jgi:hypothetical protein
MIVHSHGLRGHFGFASFHEAALYTIEENARGLRRVRYAQVEVARERAQRRWVEGQKQGVNALAATRVGGEASPPQMDATRDPTDEVLEPGRTWRIRPPAPLGGQGGAHLPPCPRKRGCARPSSRRRRHCG